MKEEIVYHLATLGQVKGTLHKESAEIFRSLKMKEVERIKSIPQLGAVSDVYEGAHHNRWEYTVLMIHLIDYCKANTNRRLNSSVYLNDDITISSMQELLNCWALLLQTGHLYWTFSTERILLECICEDNSITQLLLNAVSSQVVKEWAQRILKTCNYYDFYKLLVYFRLPRTLEDSEKTQELVRAIIDSFIVPPNQTVSNARRLYQRLRRIAYLSLDAEFSPSTLGLKLDRILRDSETFEALVNSSNHVDDELLSLEKHLG